MASTSIIGSFLVVMGLQDGDQSYGVRPETGVLMDDGTVVEISNFLVVFFLLFTHKGVIVQSANSIQTVRYHKFGKVYRQLEKKMDRRT